MAELLNHQHCKNCNRALPFGRELCVECEPEWKAYQKKRSRTVLIFYVVSALLIVLLIMQFLQGAGLL